MYPAIDGVRRPAMLFAVLCLAGLAPAAELMPAAGETALVKKYCAVCHTDASKNGGLSLQHYDASHPNPPLAAMLLSKMRSGAMGAAGFGVPDKQTQNAWIAATTAQAASAFQWYVIGDAGAASHAPVVSASIVRQVPPRKAGENSPLYRLTVACDADSGQGEVQLTWSHVPQTGRTFSVSADGAAPVFYKLDGKEEKMGNGAPGTSGLAAADLHSGLPSETLTVSDLFPGETVVFPFGDLDANARRQMSACFASRVGN